MLTETELARLIVSWKNQHGEEIRGRFCVPIDRTFRLEMYKTLIKTLIELHGYEKEDLEGKTFRMVMEASINPNSERKAGWLAAATADWNDAFDFFFPQKLLVHDTSSEPVREKRERPARETKTSYVQEEAPVELENPLTDEDRAASGIGKPDYEVDEEFLKMLQGNSDE